MLSTTILKNSNNNIAINNQKEKKFTSQNLTLKGKHLIHWYKRSRSGIDFATKFELRVVHESRENQSLLSYRNRNIKNSSYAKEQDSEAYGFSVEICTNNNKVWMKSHNTFFVKVVWSSIVLNWMLFWCFRNTPNSKARISLYLYSDVIQNGR